MQFSIVWREHCCEEISGIKAVSSTNIQPSIIYSPINCQEREIPRSSEEIADCRTGKATDLECLLFYAEIVTFDEF